MKINPYKNNYTASLAIFLLVIFVMIVVKLIMMLSDYVMTIKHYNLIIIGYFLLFIITLVASVKLKRKSTDIALQIIGLPLTIIYFFYTFAQPVFLILFATMLYVLLSMAFPYLLYKLNNLYQFKILNIHTIIYLVITSSSIIAVLSVGLIRKMIYWTPVFVQLSAKNKIKATELVDFVFTQKQIRFTIYLFYFLSLLVYNIASFETNLAANTNVETTILQAFITFLAFDSLLINFNPSVDPKELLSKMVLTMTSFLPEPIEVTDRIKTHEGKEEDIIQEIKP